MENNQMFRVTMGQTARDYPAGTTFQTIADQVQGDYPHDVLLVNRNGKLCELHKKLDRDCTLTMVTAADRPDTVTPEAGTVYLTFDDGPSANTEHLLDILDAYGVKATFFVTNCNEDYTWCIGEIARRGHSVGIHSATHDYNAIYQSEEAYFADLCRMQEIIFEQTGEYAKLVRFPGGSSNTVSHFNPGIMTRLTNDLNDMGYAYFDWNVSAADTASDATRYTVIENFKESVPKHDYSVVLQHDTNAFSVDAVEEILSWGIKNGYSFRALDLTSPAVHHSVAN